MHSADSGVGRCCLCNPERFWACRKAEVHTAKPRSHSNLEQFAYQFLCLEALSSEGKIRLHITQMALYSPHFASLDAGAADKLAKLVWRAIRRDGSSTRLPWSYPRLSTHHTVRSLLLIITVSRQEMMLVKQQVKRFCRVFQRSTAKAVITTGWQTQAAEPSWESILTWVKALS